MDGPHASKHFPEPEIIPPGRNGRRGGRDAFWISFGSPGGQRIYLAKPGFRAVLGAGLVFGLAIAAVLFVLVSALLIWLPAVGLVVALIILSRFLQAQIGKRK